MKRWNVIPAFFSPKGIQRNSKRLNGVMMAVFFTSEGWTGIAPLEVELAEHLGPCQTAGDVHHVGEGVAVSFRDEVEAVEITAWPPRTVTLLDHV